MIDHFFQIILNNVCISLVLAIIAAIVGTTLKRPFITHLLWLLVFVKLLTPPFLMVSVNQNLWMGETNSPVNFNIAEQKDIQIVAGNESGEIINFSPEAGTVAQNQGKRWLLFAWLSGSMIVLIWSICQIYRFHRLLKKESEIGSPEIQSAAREIAACLGLKAVPAIHTISANISPMVWWIGGKVWVVIPSALINQMNKKQLRWILSHELAHVRRRDYMIRWIEWLVCVCFWWNPVTWWARYNLRANEELCCDAMVLASMKPKPYTYGDSLLKAVEIITCPTRQPLVIASGINNGVLLKGRVKMILSNDLIKSKLRWLQACIMLGALIVLPLGLTNAQQDPVTIEPTVSDELSHNSQLQGIDKEIADLKTRIDEINAMLKEYQSKIEETPKREQELLSLNRDYDNLKEAYNSLLERKLEAENEIELGKKNGGEKYQSQRAQATLDFLSDEQKGMEIQLEQKEEEMRKYREKYMGGLPEQLQANLSMLQMLQTQLEQENGNLRDAENRRTAIAREIALKNQLAALQSRYSDNHPDVIRLKEMIADLEKEREQTSKQVEEPQLQEVELEIDSLKAEIEETRSQIEWYEAKVEETPKTEEGLLSLQREYDILKETYDSLQRKKLEIENQTKQLQGPSPSLSDEIKTAEQRLNEKENEIKGYRESYMGSLPEQLDTNLSLLEKFSRDLMQLNGKLRDAENKRAAILNDMPASN